MWPAELPLSVGSTACSAVITATPMSLPLVIITSILAPTSLLSRISWTPGRRTVWSALQAPSFMMNSPSATSQPSSTKGHYAPAYSAFEGVTADGETLTPWLRARGVDQLDICGIATDYCVRATALDAVREGFETTVLLDLTAAVAPDRVDEISAELANAGVVIKGLPEGSSSRAPSRSDSGLHRLEHAWRRDRSKRFSTDCVELRLLDSWQLNAQPAEVTDVGRPEEAFRIRLYEIRLDTVGSGAPNR